MSGRREAPPNTASGWVEHWKRAGEAGADAERAVALRLRHRLKAISWWRELMRIEPGGVVAVADAAEMLGVNTSRVWALIDAGELRGYRLPTRTGRRANVVVSVDSLAGCPTPLEVAGAFVTGRDRKPMHALRLPDWSCVEPPEPLPAVDTARNRKKSAGPDTL